jgi:hypothetical protein
MSETTAIFLVVSATFGSGFYQIGNHFRKNLLFCNIFPCYHFVKLPSYLPSILVLLSFHVISTSNFANSPNLGKLSFNIHLFDRSIQEIVYFYGGGRQGILATSFLMLIVFATNTSFVVGNHALVNIILMA